MAFVYYVVGMELVLLNDFTNILLLQGRYKFKKNGCEYKGAWEEGLKSGTGTFNYPDGSTYQGDSSS